MRRWAVLFGLSVILLILCLGHLSSKHCVNRLPQLSGWHFSYHNRSIFVEHLRSVQCWKLLWHDWAFGNYGRMRRWAVLFGLSVVLLILCLGHLSSEHCVNGLPQLSGWHFSCHYWSIFVKHLRGLQCW